MNKTSKETDFSSIVTQVKKNDETNPSIQLGNNIIISTPSSTVDGIKPRSTRKRHFLSFLLCCLNPSNRNRRKNSNYAVSHESGYNQESNEKFLLPSIRDDVRPKICLVIDLDETLVHSSFKPVANADFIVPVEIDGQVHQVYVTKRPHVDEFLRRMNELFECVLFTASLSKYADPVADLLDPHHVFDARLFRESCTFYNGNYIKDLNRLGRDIQKVIIIDNSPVSYIFHPENAVPVTSWFDDMEDTELLSLSSVLESLSTVDNVIPALRDRLRQRPTI